MKDLTYHMLYANIYLVLFFTVLSFGHYAGIAVNISAPNGIFISRDSTPVSQILFFLRFVLGGISSFGGILFFGMCIIKGGSIQMEEL